MFTKLLNRLPILMLLILVGFGIASCGDDDTMTPASEVGSERTPDLVPTMVAEPQVPNNTEPEPGSNLEQDMDSIPVSSDDTDSVVDMKPTRTNECVDENLTVDCIANQIESQLPRLSEENPEVGNCVANTWVDTLGINTASNIAQDPYFFESQIVEESLARTAFQGLVDCTTGNSLMIEMVMAAGENEGMSEPQIQELGECVDSSLNDVGATLLDSQMVDMMVDAAMPDVDNDTIDGDIPDAISAAVIRCYIEISPDE